LRELQNRDRVIDADEETEVSNLQGKIKEATKSVNDDWKNTILATWKTEFLGLMAFELDLKEVPICSAFGAAVKPRWAIGIIDDGPDDKENPFRNSGRDGCIDDRGKWDDDDLCLLKQVRETWKRQNREGEMGKGESEPR
jgi:hypothetical protein